MGGALVTREAEARAELALRRLEEYAADYPETNAGALDAYRDAILAAERERTAALVAVAKRFTWNPWMAGEDYRVGLLRDALRAYEEGVSE